MEANSLINNRYRLTRKLGEGGFSEVWEAIDTVTNVSVALKLLITDGNMTVTALNDAVREFLNVRALAHENILRVEHVDKFEGKAFLILPLCPKGSLESRLENTGAISDERELVTVLNQVAKGLYYLHQNNILHNDIKPGNILIDERGNYVLTDFGISGATRKGLIRTPVNAEAKPAQNTGNIRQTQRMQQRQTMRIETALQENQPESAGGFSPGYAAPEVFTGQIFSEQSDVFALGVTMYDLATGMLPFDRCGGQMLLRGAAVPRLPAHFSSHLSDIVERCMQTNPSSRIGLPEIIEKTDFFLKNHHWHAPAKEKKKSGKLIFAVLAFMILASATTTYFFRHKFLATEEETTTYDARFYAKAIGKTLYGDMNFEKSKLTELTVCEDLYDATDGVKFKCKKKKRAQFFASKDTKSNKQKRDTDACDIEVKIRREGEDFFADISGFGTGKLLIAGRTASITDLDGKWKFTTFGK
jgi:serine/threonine protein kinase